MGWPVARRTKRLWTDEEKRTICFQTTAPGVSVAQVARRYAVNANLIFKWLRDPGQLWSVMRSAACGPRS
ncbi:transposase [Paracoccus sp. S4493]|uniref:transposase n=1 Tax=Paracoccus sp. S4493 TaxID=579490 RepID=UPI001EF3FA3E|nr:transposase [Paracoccus sp. S4493]